MTIRLPELSLALLLGLCARPCWADSGLIALRLDAPRAFGYVVGDVITEDVLIDLREGFRLDPQALPTPGARNAWLTLRRVDLVEHPYGESRRFRLELEYQVFYSPVETKNLTIPGLPLIITDGQSQQPVRTPDWTFTMSPVRGLAMMGAGGIEAIRPEMLPERLPAGPYLWLSAAGLAMTALAGAMLGYRAGWFERFGRGRPFAAAARDIERIAHEQGVTEASWRDALRSVHEAFNTVHGEPLFAESLTDWFRDRRCGAELRAEIEHFFKVSYREFFDGSADPSEFSLTRLRQLCRACLRHERERG